MSYPSIETRSPNSPPLRPSNARHQPTDVAAKTGASERPKSPATPAPNDAMPSIAALASNVAVARASVARPIAVRPRKAR